MPWNFSSVAWGRLILVSSVVVVATAMADQASDIAFDGSSSDMHRASFLNDANARHLERHLKQSNAPITEDDSSNEKHHLHMQEYFHNHPLPTPTVAEKSDHHADTSDRFVDDTATTTTTTTEKKSTSILNAISKKNKKAEQRRKKKAIKDKRLKKKAIKDKRTENKRFSKAGKSKKKPVNNPTLAPSKMTTHSPTASHEPSHSYTLSPTKTHSSKGGKSTTHNPTPYATKAPSTVQPTFSARPSMSYTMGSSKSGKSSPSTAPSTASSQPTMSYTMGSSKSGKSSPSTAPPTASARPTITGSSKPSMSYTMGSSKSGKSSARPTMSHTMGSSKSGKAAMHKPTPEPTAEPTEDVSIAPTFNFFPPNALWYDSFEKGTFPDDLKWSVGTSETDNPWNDDDQANDDGRRLEDQEEEPELPVWELTDKEAVSGIYSIRTPDLSNDEANPRIANATLTTDDDWGEGFLVFSVLSHLSDINIPADSLSYYVDDVWIGFADDHQGWLGQSIFLEAGRHKITWEYRYNPAGFAPQDLPEAGVAYIDDIYFVPIPTDSPTNPLSTYPPSPNPTLQPSFVCPATESNCLPGGCDGVCNGARGTIGAGSCRGLEEEDETCANLDGIVGENSCLGEKACMDLNGEVGDGSCQNDDACFRSNGVINHYSCLGSNSCKRNKDTIGVESCRGFTACVNNRGPIGAGSCVGRYSCAFNRKSIGDGSCNYVGSEDDENGSCTNNEGTIGVGSCNGLMACYGNTGEIGDNSCNGPFACTNNTAMIGSGSCNGERVCVPVTEEDAGGEIKTYVIADNSCLGNFACEKNTGYVSVHGCIGDHACSENTADIGYKSCDGLKTCKGNINNIGAMVMSVDDVDDFPEGSCVNSAKVETDVVDVSSYLGACEDNTAVIEDKSCIGDESCSHLKANVGTNSCQGLRACKNSSGPIGHSACKKIGVEGEGICENNSESIGHGSCLGQRACKDNSAEIGSGSCTAAFACCGNTIEKGDTVCLGARDGCNECDTP